jgi:hypothetical protein
VIDASAVRMLLIIVTSWLDRQERELLAFCNVITMSGSTNSLMPHELERGLSEQDLADLLTYLKRDSVAR